MRCRSSRSRLQSGCGKLEVLYDGFASGTLMVRAFADIQRDVQQQFNAIANYSTGFGDNHNVEAMLGAEYFGTRFYGMQVYGTQAPVDDIHTVNASTVFVPGNNYSNETEYRIISAFGRLNYNFDERYLLTAVFRQDAVSSLAKNNRRGFFPGMSAGWNIHREDFFMNSRLSSLISTLKPRFSHHSGQQRAFTSEAYGNGTSYAPSQDRNFIRFELVLKEGVTTDEQVMELGTGDKLTSFSYSDGMGRTIQSVSVQASPDLNDLVQPHYFDGRNRPSRSYLPYSST